MRVGKLKAKVERSIKSFVKIKIMSAMQPETPPTYKTFVICVSRFYFQSK